MHSLSCTKVMQKQGEKFENFMTLATLEKHATPTTKNGLRYDETRLTGKESASGSHESELL